ncbi:unnamed protein product, partial [Allacma fusca]
ETQTACDVFNQTGLQSSNEPKEQREAETNNGQLLRN